MRTASRWGRAIATAALVASAPCLFPPAPSAAQRGAEEDCGENAGHIPRPNERGVLHFVDAAERVSPPSAPFTVR